MTSKADLRVIQFKGFSKSGKTTVIESLIGYLTDNGSKVTAIKNIHIDSFTIDTPGKNTWKFSQAGADPVVSMAESETAFVINQKLTLDSVIKIMDVIAKEKGLNALDEMDENSKSKLRNGCLFLEDTTKIDFLLIEGSYKEDYPLALAAKSLQDLDELLDLIKQESNAKEIMSNVFCITGVITSNKQVKKLKKKVEDLMLEKFPGLDKRLCGSLRIIDAAKNPAHFLEIYETFILTRL